VTLSILTFVSMEISNFVAMYLELMHMQEVELALKRVRINIYNCKCCSILVLWIIVCPFVLFLLAIVLSLLLSDL